MIQQILTDAIKQQDIKANIEDICFNVYLLSGTMFNLCFYEFETETWLTIVETTERGTEELRLIPKKQIDYIDIVYNVEVDNDVNDDKMFN